MGVKLVTSTSTLKETFFRRLQVSWKYPSTTILRITSNAGNNFRTVGSNDMHDSLESLTHFIRRFEQTETCLETHYFRMPPK